MISEVPVFELEICCCELIEKPARTGGNFLRRGPSWSEHVPEEQLLTYLELGILDRVLYV